MSILGPAKGTAVTQRDRIEVVAAVVAQLEAVMKPKGAEKSFPDAARQLEVWHSLYDKLRLEEKP